ncbi:MAG: dCTP deaminase [Candidatus Diapherotrites archaeon]|nr:dCTP deaminase [Candidatus Diapherotrites archaeon]
MLLGRKEILRLIREGVIEIDPFDEDSVGSVSVDLSLGNHFRVFSPQELDVYSDAVDPSKMGELIEIEDHQFIELPPGEMILGITRERIRLPENIAGILSGRSRFARLGLMVHVSSNLVHPGSNNRQVLEIVNLGPHKIRLYPGVKICQISFVEVKGGEFRPGRYLQQLLP